MELRAAATLVGLVAALTGPTVAGAQITQRRFETAADWSEWQHPAGTLEITAAGRVRPTYVRKAVNACANAGSFAIPPTRSGDPVRYGGIAAAGSNLTSAPRLIDGDPRTWWRPDPRAPNTDWWVEIDLGRIVCAERLVLRFDPEGRPLQQFRVYVTEGREAFFNGSGVMNYKPVMRTTRPNHDYEVGCSFDLRATSALQTSSPMVRYVYIAFDSDPEEVRLAEVEVHAVGDNVVLGTLARGGEFVTPESIPSYLADGSYEQYWLSQTDQVWETRGWVRVDLGAAFWVDTVWQLWFEGVEAAGHPKSVFLYVSDGTRKPRGPGLEQSRIWLDLEWEEVFHLPVNPPPGHEGVAYIFENQFPLRPVRHLLLSQRNEPRSPTGGDVVGVAELLAYGEGYVPRVTLLSPLIDLGNAANVIGLEWRGELPADTGLEVRSRTGHQIETITRYYEKSGREIQGVDEAARRRRWEGLRAIAQAGEVITEERPDSTWSDWSAAYPPEGGRFLSPNQSRFLRLRADFLSNRPERAPALDGIVLHLAPPLCSELIGELDPASVPLQDDDHEFGLWLRPTLAPGDPGFDRVTIRVPAPARFLGLSRDGVVSQPASVAAGPDSLVVELATPVRRSGTLLGIRFAMPSFRSGAAVEAYVSVRQKPGIWQRVTSGDALPDRGANTMSLFVDVGGRILHNVTASPRVVTPNGDGTNDRLTVHLTLAGVTGPTPASVTIHDLSGRLVDVVFEGHLPAGSHSLTWNAAARQPCPSPGAHVCSVRIDAESGPVRVGRVFHIAY